MRKVIIVFSVLFICLFVLMLSINDKETIKNKQGIIEKARTEIKMAGIEGADLSVAGTVKKDNSNLFWFVVGEEQQGQSYFPLEFKELENGKWAFVKTYIPIKRSDNICCLNWKNGYTFMVNSVDCQYINIYNENGEQEKIVVASHPFICYIDYIPSKYSYIDYEGNEIK